MPAYTALFRGINVGKAKRIAMADLRALAVEIGYTRPRTLLNIGNLVFEADEADPEEHAARIRNEVSVRLGVVANVIVKRASEILEVVDASPLNETATDSARLLIGFVQRPDHVVPLVSLRDKDWAPEAVVLMKHAVAVWCVPGVLDSPAIKAIGRLMGDRVTMRNWSTLEKLAAMISE